MPTTDHDRAQEVLGRAALPAIRPVSFSLQGEDVLIPAPRGSRLIDAVRGSVVAFEADAYDETMRTGWTVTVVGASRVLDGHRTDVKTPELCVIVVRVALVQGWRTGLPT